MKPSLALCVCLAGSTALLAVPACKDDAAINQEPILPGVGPIGMGGNVNTAGGSGGTAGVGGSAGTSGAAGEGGSTGGTGGIGGIGGSSGSAGTGGTAGKGGGGAGGSAGGAAGTGGGGAGGMGPVVACPTGTGAKVNVGNLVPAAGTVDFCLRESAATDLQGPLFLCGGGAAGGLAYKNVSKSVAVAPGTYDVLVVPGGDCTATPIVTVPGVVIGAMPIMLLHFGGPGGTTPTVKTYVNDPPGTMGMDALRFLHTIHGYGPLDVGITDMAGAGATLGSVVFANVAFGGISPANSNPMSGFPVDDNGYAIVADLMGSSVPVGAALTGTTATIFSANVAPGPVNSSETAFGIGLMGDAAFPVGALLCEEDDAMAKNGLLSCTEPM